MNRFATLTLSLTLLVVFAGAALAQSSFTENFTTTAYKDTLNTTADWDTISGGLKLFPFESTLAGSFDTPGSAFDVVVAGDLAFIADQASGLQIVDITNSAAPTLVGTYNTDGSAVGVAVAGDLACVADGTKGLKLIDITDPANPVRVANVNAASIATGVVVDGGLAFVSTLNGLAVVDLSDHSNSPNLVGSYNTPGDGLGIAVAGNHAFVADGLSGLQVIDITDPANPTLAGSYDTPDLAKGVTVDGNHAFVADGSSGLLMIDISDPANPILAGSYDTPDQAISVTVDGNHAFVADGLSGLLMIDISDPINPILIETYDTPALARSIVVAGEHAFVADETSGLQIIDFANPGIPTPAGFYSGILHYDIAVAGNYAFSAGWYNGLRIIDISDPSNPTLAATYNTTVFTVGVAVDGDLAFAASDSSGLLVIDISDPTNPALMGSYDTPGYAKKVAVDGNYAYVADEATLQVIDISDPANPIHAATYLTPSGPWDITIAGNYAYVADVWDGLQVINISDPTTPTFAGSYGVSGAATAVSVSGDLAFVTAVSGQTGLSVIDISDPTNPTLAGFYATEGKARGVEVAGDIAFVATGETGETGGLLMIDISDPTNPTRIDSHNLPGEGYAVAVAGDHAFVGLNNGLHVLQVFHHEFNVSDNIGQSLPFDGGTELIPAARLSSPEAPLCSWELSADGGANFQPFTPGAWMAFSTPGSDLLWRSTHNRVSAGFNPTVSEVTVEWLSEFAPIVSVTDVPNDEGRLVNFSFLRSGYDFLDETVYPIVGYAIYRRVDDPVLVQQLLTLKTMPSSKILDRPEFASFDSEQVRTLGERTFVSGSSQATSSTLPPGVWEGAGWVPATQIDGYTARVSTLSDSTSIGGGPSVFITAAVTSTVGVSFFSAPDSAYSVDNIAPGVPLNLAASYDAGGVALNWDDALESDFQFHRVYRSTDPVFVPGPSNLVQETANSAWTDPTVDPWGYHYKITTLDHAGNESEAAETQSVSGVAGDAVPLRTTLLAAYPNPFNPTTKLSFELAAPAHARLKIFDAAGRLVTTLVDEQRASGRHEIVWNGRNSAGLSVASGVYLYRFEAGEVVQTKRMMLVK